MKTNIHTLSGSQKEKKGGETLFKEVMADLMVRTDSLKKTLMLGKTEGRR